MPYIDLPTKLSEQFDDIIKHNPLDQIESNPQGFCARLDAELWQSFSKKLYDYWQQDHWCVVRDIPNQSPAGTVLTALALKHQFKTYRQAKIVKHFKMSPWTKDLSHTLAQGHFHTDINTTAAPPEITLIQCHKPDPTEGAGESRVAVLSDLVAQLTEQKQFSTLEFLQDDSVRMVDDSKANCWQGAIVENDTIRFHPQTLRAAAKRFDLDKDVLEQHLEVLHQACLKVSHVVHLEAGDALVVSNHKALHYRGECTVSFEEFPTKFNAREIFVLHLLSQKMA
jgi:hypothetical protein